MRPSALPIVRVVAACYPVDPSRAPLPGAPKALDTQVLELGAEVLQQNSPASGLVMYVHGFHHESGNRVMQEDAHHDCRPVNEDVIQCAIYDGNAYDARLIGVE